MMSVFKNEYKVSKSRNDIPGRQILFCMLLEWSVFERKINISGYALFSRHVLYFSSDILLIVSRHTQAACIPCQVKITWTHSYRTTYKRISSFCQAAKQR